MLSPHWRVPAAWNSVLACVPTAAALPFGSGQLLCGRSGAARRARDVRSVRACRPLHREFAGRSFCPREGSDPATRPTKQSDPCGLAAPTPQCIDTLSGWKNWNN